MQEIGPEDHRNEARWVSTSPPPHPQSIQRTYEGYGIADEYPEAATSHNDVDDRPANYKEAPADGYPPPTPTLDAQSPIPPQFEHDAYGTTSDPGLYAASLEYHDDEAGIAPPELDHDLMIELLTHEQIAPGDGVLGALRARRL
jgi:hypothetical protein